MEQSKNTGRINWIASTIYYSQREKNNKEFPSTWFGINSTLKKQKNRFEQLSIFDIVELDKELQRSTTRKTLDGFLGLDTHLVDEDWMVGKSLEPASLHTVSMVFPGFKSDVFASQDDYFQSLAFALYTIEGKKIKTSAAARAWKLILMNSGNVTVDEVVKILNGERQYNPEVSNLSDDAARKQVDAILKSASSHLDYQSLDDVAKDLIGLGKIKSVTGNHQISAEALHDIWNGLLKTSN